MEPLRAASTSLANGPGWDESRLTAPIRAIKSMRGNKKLFCACTSSGDRGYHDCHSPKWGISLHGRESVLFLHHPRATVCFSPSSLPSTTPGGLTPSDAGNPDRGR